MATQAPLTGRWHPRLVEAADEFPLAAAFVRWRATPPEGKPGAWQDRALDGRDQTFDVDLSGREWTRGRHAFEVELHRSPTSGRVAGVTREVLFAPPAPTVAALVGRAQPVEEAIEAL